jgi:hypothetical protein
MRLIGVSVRVSEEDHSTVCDLLTHYLEVIRQKRPVLAHEVAEEERLIDPARPPQPQVPDGCDQ